MIFEPGSYVTHAKHPELGSGELVASESGRVVIRFASGERKFVWKLVSEHLTATEVAPVLPAKSRKRAVAAKADKPRSARRAPSADAIEIPARP